MIFNLQGLTLIKALDLASLTFKALSLAQSIDKQKIVESK